MQRVNEHFVNDRNDLHSFIHQFLLSKFQDLTASHKINDIDLQQWYQLAGWAMENL